MVYSSDWKIKTKRYVAFLDILGFKDYVLRHDIDDVYMRLQTLNALRSEDDSPLQSFQVCYSEEI